MKILISTGEVSGDLQGAMLIESLYRQAELAGEVLEIYGLGGERMTQAGAKILADTTIISSIGLIESIPFILPTYRSQKLLKEYIKENPPDIVILIDYIGPNLAIGGYLRQQYPTVPIFYYIAPQSWIWDGRPQQTRKLISIADHLLAIFQQEAHFFQEKGLESTWVGHPLLDRMVKAPNREQARHNLGISSEEIIVSLFPASRKQELKYIVPTIAQACSLIQKESKHIRFLFLLSQPSFRQAIEEQVEKYSLKATLIDGEVLEAMAASDLAISKSGTVNLELALLNIPQVVVYRLSPITMWIARRILKFSLLYLAPSNIVLNRAISPELVQEAATPEAISQESLELLFNSQRRQDTLNGYQEIRSQLGEVGVCDRTAKEIFTLFKKTH